MADVLNLNVTGSITCHAWNKDRTQIAVSLNSKEVYIYGKTNSGGWQLTQTLSEHSSKVLGIDWAAKSNRLVTCGADKNAYVWSLDTRTNQWRPELVVLRINRAATCVKWSPNEQKFAIGCGQRCICVCYYEPEQCFWVAKHIKKQIKSTTLCLDWHPSSALLAAGGTDFKCRLFGAYIKEVDGSIQQTMPWAAKVNPAECIAEYTAQNHGWVHACAFNASGSMLAFAAHDSTLYVVNSENNVQETISLRTTFLPFLTLKFISNNSLVAAGHDCYPVCFGLNGNKLQLLEKLDITLNKTSSITTSAKNLFGSIDRTNQDQSTVTAINYIHQNSIKQVNVYKEDNGKVTHFSTCSLDGLVVIWDLNALEKQFANLRIK